MTKMPQRNKNGVIKMPEGNKKFVIKMPELNVKHCDTQMLMIKMTARKREVYDKNA